MSRSVGGASLRDVQALFGAGTCWGRSDGQLLERFADGRGRGPEAESAFAALVDRHGAMVHRVARSILRDRDAADDAFQGVFLVLAERAGTLRVDETLGPWLHAVTVRVASKLRTATARARRREATAAALATASYEPRLPDDLGAALHEEIARLPDRQRIAVVLCHVEGLTHDEAAARLGWPVGTVRSRLARGRERLRARLTRRGLAPSALPIGAGLVRSIPAAVRGGLAASTVRLAVSAVEGGSLKATGTVPAALAAAVLGTLSELTVIHRMKWLLGLALAGSLAAGASLFAQSGPAGESKFTTATAASKPAGDDRQTITRVYAVGDLIGAGPTTLTGRVEGEPGSEAHITFRTDAGRADFGPLIELLTETVAPGTWTVGVTEAAETVGTMEPFYLNLALVVRHTPEVHEELVARLRQLRRLVGGINGGPEEVEERLGIPATTEGVDLKVEGRLLTEDVEGVAGNAAVVTRAYAVPAERTVTVVRPEIVHDPVHNVDNVHMKTETRTIATAEAAPASLPSASSPAATAPAAAPAPTALPGASAAAAASLPPLAESVPAGIPSAPAVAAPSPTPAATSGSDARLDALERKLDALIEEIRSLRRDGDG